MSEKKLEKVHIMRVKKYAQTHNDVPLYEEVRRVKKRRQRYER